jgi:hypothetical protein
MPLDAILWLIAAVIVLFVVTVWVRRHFLKGDDPAASSPAGFTLGDLRQLHKNGQMTDEEFERAKAQVVAAMTKAAERAAAALAANNTSQGAIPRARRAPSELLATPQNYRRKRTPPQTGFDVLPPKARPADPTGDSASENPPTEPHS